MRYYLKHDDGEWIQVPKTTWVQEERCAGFHPKGIDRGQPATGGFSHTGYGSWPSSIQGKIDNYKVEEDEFVPEA